MSDSLNKREELQQGAEMPPIPHDMFPVQDATLSAAALANSVLEAYRFSEPLVCRFFRKGICDTYRIETDGQTYYFKVYKHARRTRLDVAEEVRLLNHLAANGISVAKPVVRQDGQYISHLAAPEGPRYGVLFEAACGDAGDGGDARRIEALGEMVGRMHRCADQLCVPYRRDHLDMRHLVDDNLEAIAPRMDHRGADFALIQEIAHVCKKRIAQSLPLAQPAYGICHGDLHGGDVCYGDGQTPMLFDFDSSGCGWRALDIGVFLASVDWMNITDEAETERQRRLDAFLAGYSTVRELSSSELAIVQLGPPVRHIFLMGHVLRYTTVYQGEHWANDDFYDWHMTWFRYWASGNL